MIDAPQIRAARALLNWKQQELATAAGLSFATIQRMETQGTSRSSVANVSAIQKAFEAAGVIFIPENGEGPGVRLAKVRGGTE